MAKKRKYARDASSHAEVSRKSDVALSEIPPRDPGMLEEETPFSLTCHNGLLVHEQPANYGILDDPVDFDITYVFIILLWIIHCNAEIERRWRFRSNGRAEHG
jgi:hypothetical protein